MSNIVFARPRHNYDSYTDLYRLITLSGYPLIYADEMDPHGDDVYIVTILNGETQHGWPGATAEIILWDLEWRVDDPPSIPGVNRVWASDKWYADQIGAQYVQMGSDPALAGDDGGTLTTERQGLAALMYLGPYRRNNLVNRLRGAGITIHEPAWGQVRSERLAQAAAMLHIHQHETVRTVAPLRWALAATWCLPVFSEMVPSNAGLPGTYWIQYHAMASLIPTFMRNRAQLWDMGMALHNHLCHDYTFADSVQAAI